MFGTDISAVVTHQFENAEVDGVGVGAIQDVQMDVSFGHMTEQDRDRFRCVFCDNADRRLRECRQCVKGECRVELERWSEQSYDFRETFTCRP